MAKPTLAAVADRIRGILHNHPRSQYVRLTKDEAQAVVAGAPLDKLGIDTLDETRRIAAKVVRTELGSATDEAVGMAVTQHLGSAWFRQELARHVEYIDRDLAEIAATAEAARRELRAGRLPTQLATGSGWDQTMRDLRTRTVAADAVIDGAIGYAYATAPKEQLPEG